MPQLDSATYISQIFWLCLSFGVAFLFSAFFALPRFSKILHQRQMQINEKEKSIEHIQKQCDALLLKIESELQESRAHAQRQIKLVLSQLNAEAIHQKSKLHDHIHGRLLAYEDQLKQQQQDIEQNLIQSHGHMAQHILNKLMPQNIQSSYVSEK